jgi:hypothetical protein
MPNLLVLNQSVPAWRCRVVWIGTLQRLHPGHFVVGNDEFALLGECRCLLIQRIDKPAFGREGFIFGAIQPIATLVGTNRCFFLKASPHV